MQGNRHLRDCRTTTACIYFFYTSMFTILLNIDTSSPYMSVTRKTRERERERKNDSWRNFNYSFLTPGREEWSTTFKSMDRRSRFRISVTQLLRYRYHKTVGKTLKISGICPRVTYIRTRTGNSALWRFVCRSSSRVEGEKKKKKGWKLPIP